MRKLLVFVLVLLAGCDFGPPADVLKSKYPALAGSYELPGTIAYEFVLTDGTRCVTTRDGGMDCDWSTGHAEQSSGAR